MTQQVREYSPNEEMRLERIVIRLRTLIEDIEDLAAVVEKRKAREAEYLAQRRAGD